MDLPEEFISRMREMLGEEELEAFLSSYDRPLVRGLRFNPLKVPVPAQCEGKGRASSAAEGVSAAGVSAGPAQHDVLTQAVEHYGLRPVPWAEPWGFYYREEDAGSSGQDSAGPGRREKSPQGRSAGGEVPEDACRPGKSPLHEAGAWYIQEPTAMAPAALAGLVREKLLRDNIDCTGSVSGRSAAADAPGQVPAGYRILDLCAAPGGKTTMLAGQMAGRGLLVANEIDAARARVLSQNVERMGITNAVVTNESPAKLAGRFVFYFDEVLVDAPCSGEGMFRREPQAAVMWGPETAAACAARQAGILECAAGMVRGGGLLVYSTCTFAPEEDEGAVADFLARHPEFSLVDLIGQPGAERMTAWGFESGRPEWARAGSGAAADLAGTVRLWPHRLEGEGHFAAVLRKEGVFCPEPAAPGAGLAGKENAAAADFAAEHLTAARLRRLQEESGSGAARFGDGIWLVPHAAELDCRGLRVLRPGLHFGTVKKNRFEPAHALAMALRPEDVVRRFDLAADSKEAAAWLRGETLPCDGALKGWTLVTADGVSIGWGKASGGVMKNHYPKGLRRPY